MRARASNRGALKAASPARRIIGIDPGTVITGWGVIEEVENRLVHLAHGVIATGGTREQGVRLSRVYRGIEEVMEAYRPDSVSIERVFFARNAQSALKLGQARGVVLLAAANQHAPVHEYTAAEIKLAVVGYGRATKDQVQMMVASLLRLPSRLSPDAADALAAAICHVHTQPFQARLAEIRAAQGVDLRARRL